MAVGSLTFFFYDCMCMSVLMFVCTCVQISEVSSGAVLTLQINE